jgi:hypothetical protein
VRNKAYKFSNTANPSCLSVAFSSMKSLGIMLSVE